MKRTRTGDETNTNRNGIYTTRNGIYMQEVKRHSLEMTSSNKKSKNEIQSWLILSWSFQYYWPVNAFFNMAHNRFIELKFKFILRPRQSRTSSINRSSTNLFPSGFNKTKINNF